MHILNSNLWPESTSKVEAYIVELNAFKKVFDHYIGMEVFKVFTVDDVTEGFFCLYLVTHVVILTFLILSQWGFRVKCSTSTRIRHHGPN